MRLNRNEEKFRILFRLSSSFNSKMNLRLALLSTADTSHLGRVDHASLSTQTLMEIFIEGLENRDVICGSTEEPNDIDQWRGFAYCPEQPADAAEKQFKIEWCSLNLMGTIDLRWLPRTVVSFIIWESKLSGSLNLTALPPSIQRLDLSFNAFSGEIDLCYLPVKIETLHLGRNQLSGSLNLEKLPQSLQVLYLNSNRFSGTVCLRHLPPSLQRLAVNENELSGTVELTNLPAGMSFLLLFKNAFSGETDFSQVPQGMQMLNVQHTSLCGKIVKQRNQNTNILVDGSNVQVLNVQISFEGNKG